MNEKQVLESMRAVLLARVGGTWIHRHPWDVAEDIDRRIAALGGKEPEPCSDETMRVADALWLAYCAHDEVQYQPLRETDKERIDYWTMLATAAMDCYWTMLVTAAMDCASAAKKEGGE